MSSYQNSARGAGETVPLTEDDNCKMLIYLFDQFNA